MHFIFHALARACAHHCPNQQLSQETVTSFHRTGWLKQAVLAAFMKSNQHQAQNMIQVSSPRTKVEKCCLTFEDYQTGKGGWYNLKQHTNPGLCCCFGCSQAAFIAILHYLGFLEVLSKESTSRDYLTNRGTVNTLIRYTEGLI